MPLRDHFHSPVNDTHSWDELHGQWPGEMVRHLRTISPSGFRSAPHIGIACDCDLIVGDSPMLGPPPTYTLETDLIDQDEYEVRIYDTERGRTLVATIELVSPANKDRPRARDLFTGKAAALLNQGVCVSVVDLVSVRQANLYVELVEMYGGADPRLADPPPYLYAATLRTYKPPKRRPRLETWFYPMTYGQPLPTLPIWLSETLRIELPLEVSYVETCRVLGIA